MDICEYALQLEKDGEKFYRNIADNTDDEGLKSIMLMLADEEVKHRKAIEKMQNNECQLAETDILGDAKNIFQKMSEGKENFDLGQEQIAIYKEAQEIERRSQLFYEEKAEEVEEEDKKELLRRLAEEEKKHYFLLDNIIEFVSRPKYWLENAEWNHLEQY
ncbi:MAG: rubrerythrin [Candidatus Latescibacteria bacterium]|nr:rubrerythrin [bacterium]MBD3425527.1 rubrerythrin [Candidatus Latescibacterota bacterium]